MRSQVLHRPSPARTHSAGRRPPILPRTVLRDRCQGDRSDEEFAENQDRRVRLRGTDMGKTGVFRALMVVALATLVIASWCSSDDEVSEGGVQAIVAGDYTVPTPEVSRPPAEGAGISRPQPASPLPAGYTEEELFLGGTATSFESIDTPDNGEWTVAPDEQADYRTRVI